MADPVTALTHWRRNRDQHTQHTEHTREVVRQELPDGAKQAIVMMAERIERLERVIARLAQEAARED